MIVARIYRLWQRIIYSTRSSTEPRVFHRSDRTGNAYFEIYDPLTGKSNCFGSEQEIRAWLDQPHY